MIFDPNIQGLRYVQDEDDYDEDLENEKYNIAEEEAMNKYYEEKYKD